MSNPMKIVLDLIATLGELEWARCVGGIEPLRPPFVAWRFENPDANTEKKITDAVSSYMGTVQWVVDKGGRNWVIQPDAFRTYASTFRTDGEALQRFAAGFPTETHAALDDIANLAVHLRKELLSDQ